MTAASLQYAGDTLYIAGELDFESVAQLCQTGCPLLHTQQPVSRIDLSGVRYSNSAGVALLVEWLAVAKHKQQPLTFTNLPEQMRTIIRIAELERILPLV